MYLDFFGLREAPFGTTADPRWRFVAPSYEAARATLVLGITDRRGLLCLIGEPGTGKTMLVRDLIGSLPPDVRTVTLLHPGVTFAEMVEQVASTLGVPLDGLPASRHLDELQRALARQAADGGNAVLFIDEAQAVPFDALTGLPSLCSAKTGGGMQVVLVGQPTVEEKLAESGLADRVAVRATVGRLSTDEVAAYIAARLAVAGVTGSLFAPAAVARIARVTGGVPRMVNTIADASLMAAFSARSAAVGAEHVQSAWKAYARFGPTAPPSARPEADDTVVAEAPPKSLLLAPPRGTTVPRTSMSPWLAAGAAAIVAAVSAVVLLLPAWWPVGRTPPTAPADERVGPQQPPALELLPTPGEALDVVDAFRRAYEARDPARLESLFAADAVDDGRTGSANLAAAHGHVLERLDDVVYLQPAAQLQPRGVLMEVRAPFVIRYHGRTGDSGEVRGTAVWQIGRRAGEPRIVALAHELPSGSVRDGGSAVVIP